MRIFLTGGTGLIGSHVAEQLRERGDQVTALVRRSSDRRHLTGLGCRLVEGDVSQAPSGLAAAMAGCDAVIHAAAKVFERGGRRAFERANVAGTRGVLEGAALAVPRVVHLSSVAVYAGLALDGPLTEDEWVRADPSKQASYAASKHASERVAWELHRAGAIRLTTLRPSVVYGERDRAAAPIMIRYASLPLIPLLRGGRTRLPLVYAGNVARGVLAALDREAAVGRAYNLAQDHPLTGRELVAVLAHELGRRPRTVSVPARPLEALVAVVEGVARWTRLPRPSFGRAIRTLTRDNPYDSGRARIELGWTNLVPHREGLRRTMEWWRHREGGR
jgi:2-alkyl-3-oxoalkanoate reductase